MAPSTRSRKGKKAWRKNIDATDIEAFVEEQTYQERREPAADALTDEQLFFVDTSADKEEAKAVQEGKQRKRKYEAKPLRSQEIIEQAHKAKKVLSAPLPKPVNNLSNRRELNAAKPAIRAAEKKVTSEDALGLDIWGDDILAPSQGSKTNGAKFRQPKKPKFATTRVKAVEVDMAGCSYNPDAEQHQDALAALVASEMEKELKKVLCPVVAPPKTVHRDGPARTELDELLADDEEEEAEEQEQEGGEGEAGAARKAQVKKTKKDRLREERRKAQELHLADRSALKTQRRDLDRLRDLSHQVVTELDEQKLRLDRRKANKAEEAASQPPRLGRHKFEASAVQVLTTDELRAGGGGLRRLAACPLLAADRFKNLQQRGIVEPRVPVPSTKPKRVSYERNSRREKAEAGQEEIRELQQRTKALRKKLKREQLNAV